MEKNIKTRGLYYFALDNGWNNQQLVKNCGALAYVFHKNYGFHSVMVGYKHGEHPNLQKYLPGVELEFYKGLGQEFRIQYIRENYQKIDLMVCHNHFEDFGEMIKLYKSLRPDGKVYLETDTNDDFQDRFVLNNESNQDFLNNCDVVGVSCRKMQKFLSRKWKCKVDYITNGFYNFANIDIENIIDWHERKNIILTVGRLGVYPKNTELLLHAFSMIHHKIPTWKLQLVGSMTKDFKELLKHKFFKDESLKEKIIISNEINDKVELMNIYQHSKIFVLPSISEGGIPNVIAEALFNGCYIVSSDISGSIDATNNSECGDIFPINNIEALENILLMRCSDDEYLFNSSKKAIEYAHHKLDFEKIMARLYYLLYGSENKGE